MTTVMLFNGFLKAQLNNELLLSIVNGNNFVAACDLDYLNSPNLMEIKKLAMIDMDDVKIDMGNAYLKAVNPYVLNNRKIEKSKKKNKKYKNCHLYGIESKVKSGDYSFDLNYLNIKHDFWYTKTLDNDINSTVSVDQFGGLSRAGYEISFIQSNNEKKGLLFKFKNKKDWFVFDYDDTLMIRKKNNAKMHEQMLYAQRRKDAESQIQNFFGSDINLFFRDTSIYIFEVPRVMESYNGIPVLSFTDSLEFFTYQITNDSNWYVKQFLPDTTKRANFQEGTYSKSPKFISKIKLQDLSASRFVDLSTLRREQLYTVNWQWLEQKAIENPDDYQVVIDSIVEVISKLSNHIKEDPTFASQITYESYKSIYKNIKPSDWKSNFTTDVTTFHSKISEGGVGFNMWIRNESGKVSFTLGGDKIEIELYKKNYGRNGTKVDSNIYIVEGKEYDRRFDNFYPFKTSVFSNACLLHNNGCEGYYSKTVSGEENLNKLLGLMVHDKFMEVWRKNREEEMKAKEKAKVYQKLSKQYGSKYAKAFLNMEIIVGMPKPLAEKLIKSFYVVDDYSQYNNSTTYYLTSMFVSSSKMTVNIDNNKVTRVHSF